MTTPLEKADKTHAVVILSVHFNRYLMDIIQMVAVIGLTASVRTGITKGSEQYNFLQDSSFESVSGNKHWQYHKRTSLWDYRCDMEFVVV